MSGGFEDKTQFDYLYDALAQKYPGLVAANDNASIFQFAQAPVAANWVTGNDGTAYDIANSVPVNIDGFYVHGDQLDTAYSTLIKSIKPKIGDNNPDYKKLKLLADDQNSKMISLADQATKAYYTWAASNTKPDGTPQETKTEWLNDPLGGKAWGNKLNDLQSQIDELDSEMSAILKTMDAGLSDALALLGTDTMPVSRGGKAIQVPSVTIGGDLSADKSRWDTYEAGQYDFDIIINKDETITTPWKTIYTTEVKQTCWRTEIDTKVNTSRIIMDKNYNLRVSAVGLQAYQITRGRWYNPVFVSPDVEIVPGAAGLTADSFFGLNGSLHLIPETIVIMYKPTFTLTVSTETYKQQFVANADVDVNWVDILGFRFKFDGLASLQPVEGGNGTTTVTFRSGDNAVPQILGVTSKVEYNGQEL